MPSPTVKLKGLDLRPFTVLVQLGLRVIRLPVGRGLGKGNLTVWPSDWKKSDRVTPPTVLAPHGRSPT